MGDDPNRDQLIYLETDASFSVHVDQTNSGSFIVINIDGIDTNEIRYLNTSDPSGTFQVLYPRETYIKTQLEHREDYFYLRTNDEGAYNYKIVRVPIR